MKKLALYLLASTALLGCGSDNSDSSFNPTPTPTPTPSVKLAPGFYSGVTQENEVLDGLVDDESRLWFTYAEVDSNNDENVIGFINSNNSVLLNNSKFTVSGRNYSYDNRSSRIITINGNYKSEAINGTFFEQPSNPITYNLKFDTSLAKKHTLNLINNKTFNGPLYVTSGTGEAVATITFTTNGNFTGADSKGCNITGKFTPAVSGRYYVSTVTFGQINCTAAGETHTGVSILDNSDDNLLILATNGSGGRGMYFGS